MKYEISDEILNAHIDNELDPAERATLLERIAADSALRTRACERWQLKQMVRGAFPLPRTHAASTHPRWTTRWTNALAASILLVCGLFSGWFAHERIDTVHVPLKQIDAIRADGGRVVLHLFSDEPARMEAALHMAEQLANTRDKAGNPLRVEFIANGPGLHLLRSGGSPYAARVTALRQSHDNLRLIACHQAIERMHERGINVVLLPQVEEATSAESQLAERLTQGWRYLQA